MWEREREGKISEWYERVPTGEGKEGGKWTNPEEESEELELLEEEEEEDEEVDDNEEEEEFDDDDEDDEEIGTDGEG